MADEAQLTELLQPLLNDGQFYVVDTRIAGRRGGQLKVTILLDTDAGITIEECANISRQLGDQLETDNVFGDAPFILEVSSPGVDQPLTQRRQYLKNVGRTLTATRTDGQQIRGVLEAVGEADVTLNVIPEKKNPKKKASEAPVGAVTLPLSEVVEARIEVVFN
jgi:ribosome maturation factor RimP